MYELFPEYAEAASSRPYRIDRWGVRNCARRVISISSNTANDLNRMWGIPRERVDVVPLGSSFVGSTILQSQNLGNRARIKGLCSEESLLSPYNLEPRKNLGALLKAVATLRSQHPKLRLLLFGRAAVDSTRELQFNRTVNELGLGETVHLLGPLEDSDLAWLYAHTTLFVFPSLYEGFGLPVLEAMASGACVVARNASAIAEIAGEAAALVETTDPDSLAASISALLDKSGRRAHLGAAARTRAEAFTIERMARLTYESYCAALAGGARASLRRANSQISHF